MNNKGKTNKTTEMIKMPRTHKIILKMVRVQNEQTKQQSNQSSNK